MDLRAWLRGIGLERYEGAFRENAIDEQVLVSLTAEDLRDLGVSLVGHRRKLLNAIAALRLGETDKTAPHALPASNKFPQDGAERRQLTVLLGDLVDSIALAADLDPEDLRDVIAAYHRCCSDLVVRHGGFVARGMGDSLLAYFGYPHAHEHDAERAVQTGLALVKAVPALAVGTASPLQVRVGIATGLVVVGDIIGSGAAEEQDVVGETPNLAARLQALAEPGGVVIASSTKKLIGSLFEYRDLGTVALKGFDERLPAWQVLGVSEIDSRFEALRTSNVALVGRDEEVELLLRRWAQAKRGEGSMALVLGEAGIGKSRIVETVVERVAEDPHTRLRYFCSPYHQDTALHPIITQLERSAGLRREDTSAQRLDKLEAVLAKATSDLRESVPLIADLLSIPTDERYPVLNLAPQKRKEKTLRALLAQIEGLAARQPVLAVFEDVHWSDPTTRETLDLIADLLPALRALVLVTFRPDFVPPWVGSPHVTLITLNRLPRQRRAEMISLLTGGKALPEEIADQIMDHTDGIPLFIEELTKAIVESGMLTEAGDRYTVVEPVPPLAIPATLSASLLARLDRLAPTREVAQIAAALGRQFSHELISAVALMPQQRLETALAQLVSAELMFRRGIPPDAEYTFKHTLVQDAAYSTLLRSQRRLLHARIAVALESNFAGIAETQPEVLARHCAEAGLIEKAVGYRLKAGRQAATRSAMTEAVAQLRKGLELVRHLPDDVARRQGELDLQTALGAALTAAKGYASTETGEAFARARQLCELLDNTAAFARVAYGQWLFHMIRGEAQRSHQVAAEILSFADKSGSKETVILGHRVLGVSLFATGQLPSARKHLDIAASLQDDHQPNGRPARGRDARIMIPTWTMMIAWWQGYLDQARSARELALAEASSSSALHSRLFAQCFGVLLSITEGEYARALKDTDAIRVLAADLHFPFFVGTGAMFDGITRAHLGDDEGVAAFRNGLELYRRTGAKWAVPLWLMHFASFPNQPPDVVRGTLAEAASLIEETGEQWVLAELYRLRGDLALTDSSLGEGAAESDYLLAKRIAAEQGSKLQELRAAMSLCRLWGDTGKREQALNVLAPIYDWFTEGFDTVDLKRAKALLDALAV